MFLRKGLVAAQVAFSFLLLFGAGLFVRSLQNLKSHRHRIPRPRQPGDIPVGARAERLRRRRARVHFYQELLDRLRAVPGVKSAALASVPLLHGWEWDSTMSVEGHTAKDGEDMQAFMNSLSPGYFADHGHAAARRAATSTPRDTRRKTKVAIVNQRSPGTSSATGARSAGISATAAARRRSSISRSSAWSRTRFTKGRAKACGGRCSFRTAGNNGVGVLRARRLGSTSAYAALRREVKELDAAMPVYELKTLAAQLDQTLLTERLIALLSAGFGLLATLLAAIGLYGVMAFVVARRTKEMGLRMALGAQRGLVIWLVMKEVLLLLAIGLAVGVPSAIGLGRYRGDAVVRHQGRPIRGSVLLPFWFCWR